MPNVKAKFLCVVATALCASAVLAAPESRTVAVSVTAIVEHKALDQIRDGIKDELQQAGFEAGKNLKWDYQSAQGNNATAAQIARKFVGNRPDVMVALSTPSAQALVAANKTIPIVYAAVTDPVAAQLVKTWQPSGTNVTGVSDALDAAKQVELMRTLLPALKRVGMVYNPGEANSVVVVEQMRTLLQQHGIQLVTAAAPRTVDVSSAARTLVGKVDVIYSNTDNNVMSAYEAVVKVGNDAKIPLVGADPDSVRRGASAALGVSYYQMGRQTGKVVLRILNGEKPGDIASAVSQDLSLSLNTKAAQKQGLVLSPALLKTAASVM